MRLLKEHYLKLLLFGGIFTGLLICCTPDVTWANLDYDLFDFMYSSTYLNIGHATGFPLYTLLGWLVVKLPGNDAWDLALCLSVIPTMITCGLIFWIIGKKTGNKYAPYLGTLAYGANMVVFSQAIIPEIYSLTTMLMVLSYCLLETNRKWLALLALGFGSAVHYLAIVMIPVVMWRYRITPKWGDWRPLLALIPGVLLYLYIPLANSAPHMSLGPNGFTTFREYFSYHEGALFSLAIWDLPQRFWEGLVVAAASFGIALPLAAVGIWRKENRNLFWLSVVGLVYYLTTLGPTAYVHQIPAYAFGAIGLGLVVEKIPSYTTLKPLTRYAVPAVAVCSLALLAANTWNYDIGRTLDPAPTGAREFMTSLDSLDDGTIVVCWDAVTYAGIFYYNEQNDRHLQPIKPCFISPSHAYDYELQKLEDLGLDYSSTGDFRMPPPSHDWLKDANTWSYEHTRIFAQHNPDRIIYAVLSDLEDRSRRNVKLLQVTKDSEPWPITWELPPLDE